MARILTLLAIVAAVGADPLVFTSPYLASPFVTPYGAPYGAPYTSAALVAPGPAVPAAVQGAVPFSSVSAYSYGSSYSIKDYAPLVNAQAAPLYSSAYSLPYSYADWFYRR